MKASFVRHLAPLFLIAGIAAPAFSYSGAPDPGASAASDNGAILLAQTQGMDNRQDRRDDRQDDRQDRRGDRQDCRQEEGVVGEDKRDCKQDERQDRNDDG